ncbi:DUF4153 domain-containing protein [Georgenia sp.]
MKFGVLVWLSVVTAALVSEIGGRAGVPGWLTVPVTVAAALGVTQWLARGMTSPLREMTDAAARMATGDRARRVSDTSADEVGRLARAFNTMAADLEASDQQRRQLLATVSHELRTPLAAQQALLENLVDGVVRPDDEALRGALAQSERLGELVGDLLDVSRAQAGAVTLHLAPVRVATLLERAVAEARVGGRDVGFEVRVTPPDLTVTADAARLAQVVANLLDNAVRHSPAGAVVTVRAAEQGTDRWSLDVADDGPGITPDQAEQIFTRFWTTGVGGGTGLGLAIARWICELHGGTIAALEPAAGGGARIRALLPRHPGSSATRTAESAAAVSADAPAVPPAPAPGPGPSAGVGTSPLAVTPGPGEGSFVESLFGGRWPGAEPATAAVPLVASLAVGALGAAVLPDRAIGVGTFVVLLLAGLLVWRSARLRARPWTIVTAVLCLGLGSLLVLRAAEWLAVLALLVIAVLVTTALTGARGLVPMVAGAAAWVLAAVRGLPLLGRTLTAASGHTLLWPVVRTAAFSLVVLVVFGGLFASGDAVLGSWVARLVPDLSWDPLILRAFVFVMIAGIVLAACYLALNPPPVENLAAPAPRPVARVWEWLVPVGIVVAVFVTFVLAQASAMFGGDDYVLRVAGITYADYVHQGFGQLTVATVLTLATVAVAVRKAPHETAQDRFVLRLVLGLLLLLTLVVVASALYRMSVYQGAFGYTVLRVLVDTFELWLGLLVVLVIVAGIRWSGWWLPRAALASGATLLLAFGLVNPEAWVARQNIERFDETGKIDVDYLAGLGPDARPVIFEGLHPNLGACALATRTQDDAADALSWNLGRVRAAQYAVPVGGCR